MKKIILFFSSFDPICNYDMRIAANAIKIINGDKLYFGLTDDSNSKKLAPYTKRKKMIELAINKKNKFSFVNVKFNYKNIHDLYKKICEICGDNNEYYIIIDERQTSTLIEYKTLDLLKEKFKVIIASNNNFNVSNNCIYLNKFVCNVCKEEIIYNNYKNIPLNVKNYIIENNIYLEEKIKKYLSKNRFKHVQSVKTLALQIYKNNKNGLNKNKIISACLLHDIAKEYPKNKIDLIMKKYYPSKLEEDQSLYHQYVGEYIAKKKFHIKDEEILLAIKYHTTANANISKLSKIIYVSDKLDPLRGYDSSDLIKECIKNLDNGFILVLKDNLEYFKLHNIKFKNQETVNAINYYLKGEL